MTSALKCNLNIKNQTYTTIKDICRNVTSPVQIATSTSHILLKILIEL